jgi:hypothetical protein
MPHGVDAAMDPVQPPLGGAPLDRPRAQPQRPQLRERNHPVLTRGELRERAIQMRWHALTHHGFAHPCHRPSIGALASRG